MSESWAKAPLRKQVPVTATRRVILECGHSVPRSTRYIVRTYVDDLVRCKQCRADGRTA